MKVLNPACSEALGGGVFDHDYSVKISHYHSQHLSSVDQKSDEGFMKSLRKFNQSQELVGWTHARFHLTATRVKRELKTDHGSPLDRRIRSTRYKHNP